MKTLSSSSLLPTNSGLAKGLLIFPMQSSISILFLMSANVWAKLNMEQPTSATLELKLAPTRVAYIKFDVMVNHSDPAYL